MFNKLTIITTLSFAISHTAFAKDFCDENTTYLDLATGVCECKGNNSDPDICKNPTLCTNNDVLNGNLDITCTCFGSSASECAGSPSTLPGL